MTMSHRPVIVPYRDSWAREFATLSKYLRDVLGPRAQRIEHIGSTAVPGLAAKDVIDVQISMAAWDPVVHDSLAALGFRAIAQITCDHVPPGAPDSADEWRKWFFVEPLGNRRTNLHVRQAGRLNARYALLFRDYLKAHPRVADAYAELKRRLSASLAVPDDYADVKDPAVDLIYLAAEQWASSTGAWHPSNEEHHDH
jgi:GrpB-like predicted nucleotidyltransferase (UPF0157 family)